MLKNLTVDDWYEFLNRISSEFRLMSMDEQGKTCMDCVKCAEGKHAISNPLAYYAVKSALVMYGLKLL